MKINLIATADGIHRGRTKAGTAVVFDVLRATSTIVTALANGCRAVLPVITVEEALALYRNQGDLLLGGERQSLLIPGFHHGNSPLEYVPETVSDKTLVITTTNGTRAIRGALHCSGRVLIGSMLNAKAVAAELAKRNEDLVMVCAGTRGEFSLEDTVAAGMVILELTYLIGEGNVILQSDLAVSALRLAMFYKEDPLKALYDSLHGQQLAKMGLSEDLAWCARLNCIDLVPAYDNGKITAIKSIHFESRLKSRKIAPVTNT